MVLEDNARMSIFDAIMSDCNARMNSSGAKSHSFTHSDRLPEFVNLLPESVNARGLSDPTVAIGAVHVH